LAASFRSALRGARKADRTIVLYGLSVRMFWDWLTAQAARRRSTSSTGTR